MKRTISITVGLLVILSSTTLFGQSNRYMAKAKFLPVAEFLETNATLSQWFEQYVATTSSRPSFDDFLKKLMSSEVLIERSKRAGLSHNQLFAPMITLLDKDWQGLEEAKPSEIATVRLSLLELDIALGAIEATLPSTAHEEFRREVLRNANVLTDVAEVRKLPKDAVEAMNKLTFTEKEHILSDRINSTKGVYRPNTKPAEDIVNQQNRGFRSGYAGW